MLDKTGTVTTGTMALVDVVVPGGGDAEAALAIPPELEDARREAQAAGRTAVVAGWDGELRVLLAVADTLKATSAEAVRRLRSLGLRPVLLTGDNQTTAEAVAGQVGIEE